MILGWLLAPPAWGVTVRAIWHPNGHVNAMAQTGGVLYIGGLFSQLDSPGNTASAARANLAAIDLATGLPTAWNPGADGEVMALEISSGARLVAGGDFSNAGGLPRSRLAELFTASDSATTWNPGADSTVRALQISGSKVWIGGDFANAGSAARSQLAELDLGSNLAAAWNPGTGPGGASVRALRHSANTLYIAGSFATAQGQAREGLAALDTNTGLALAFHPSQSLAAGWIFQALELSSGRLITGGDFSGSLGGGNSDRLTGLDLGTSTATWLPAGGADAAVRALRLDGARMYVGGLFSSLGGLSRQRLAALYASDASPDPSFQADVAGAGAAVNALLVSGPDLAVAGDFGTIDGQPSPNLALITALAAPTQTPTPFPTPVPVPATAGYTLRVYPHPFGCPGATLGIFMEEPGQAVIGIYSLRGALVSARTESLPAGDAALFMSCEGLRPGLYLLRARLEFASGRTRRPPDYHLHFGKP